MGETALLWQAIAGNWEKFSTSNKRTSAKLHCKCFFFKFFLCYYFLHETMKNYEKFSHNCYHSC
uniref:Uncharacterized protein n=1 Tax=Heterorhabditis bacteriophora TaxID=37862 RepID=A0A1I7X1F7_HETBA